MCVHDIHDFWNVPPLPRNSETECGARIFFPITEDLQASTPPTQSGHGRPGVEQSPPFIESNECVSRDKTNNLLKYDTACMVGATVVAARVRFLVVGAVWGLSVMFRYALLRAVESAVDDGGEIWWGEKKVL